MEAGMEAVKSWPPEGFDYEEWKRKHSEWRRVSTLKEALKDWHDFDGAQWQLGRLIGLWGPGETKFETTLKGVFWCANPLSEALDGALSRLVEAGVLERDEDWRYRWNPEYRGDWEA